MAFKPTSEQCDIMDAAATGKDVVVEALAGTGKTSTLELISRENAEKSFCYIAFNKSIADEAKRRFPRNVTAATAHSFAYHHIKASRPELLDRLQSQERVPRWKQAQILRIREDFVFGDFKLRDRQLAGLVMESVARFCASDAPEPGMHHIPRVPGMDLPEPRKALQEFVFPYVQRAWADITSGRGQLRFMHDHYLKLASMDKNFRLPGEVVLFDEAQDADPVVMSIVQRMQTDHGVQLIPNGDSNQQIYAWRGAIDALDQFDAEYRLPLTASFRFGQSIADEANRILSLLETPYQLQGLGPESSALAFLDNPDTVLCRTNAEAVSRLLTAQMSGIRAGLVGGTQAVQWLAQAALDLTEGRPTDHPELRAFESWNQVREYVTEDKEARDLQTLVNLVDDHTPQVILAAVERAVPERAAQLLISTAHKSKGREWNSVKLASDFPMPMSEEGLSAPELRLAYVAVTRGKQYVDSSALTPWIEPLTKPAEGERVFLTDVVTVLADVSESQICNVMCDPEDEDRVIMTGTKYNPELVKAQQELPFGDPKMRYRADYAGFEKVRIVLARAAVLDVAERFGLTVSPDAKERIEQRS
ncbi:MAG: UvrD-helicase domain-containing protein [Candidatus Nanopelagicales bacterium]